MAVSDKRRRINKDGLDLIKHFEGFESRAYLCPSNVWTIGYGHTSRAGPPVVKPDMRMDKETAEEVLQNDLDLFEQVTQEILGDANKYINENQFSALVSFCFNTGPTALKKSTLMRKIHERDLTGAGNEFKRWVYGNGKKLNGLVKRRTMEKSLFNKKVEYRH